MLMLLRLWDITGHGLIRWWAGGWIQSSDSCRSADRRENITELAVSPWTNQPTI